MHLLSSCMKALDNLGMQLPDFDCTAKWLELTTPLWIHDYTSMHSSYCLAN